MKQGIEKYRENIKIAMKRYKIKSVKELACMSGVSESIVNKLMDMSLDPKMQKGQRWRPSAIKVSKYLNVIACDLFPEYSYKGLMRQVAELKNACPKEILTMPYITQKWNKS